VIAACTLDRNMRHHNINEHEIMAAVRRHGLGSLKEADAVVLEIDGTFSVVRRSPAESPAPQDVDTRAS
jgi:uncharacterized membrane protein YcaP (DUF421 family)